MGVINALALYDSFEKKETLKSTCRDEKGKTAYADLENIVSEGPTHHLLCSNGLSLKIPTLNSFVRTIIGDECRHPFRIL